MDDDERRGRGDGHTDLTEAVTLPATVTADQTHTVNVVAAAIAMMPVVEWDVALLRGVQGYRRTIIDLYPRMPVKLIDVSTSRFKWAVSERLKVLAVAGAVTAGRA
jgi:hypothetical protein